MNKQATHETDLDCAEFLVISRKYLELPPADSALQAKKPYSITHEQPRIYPMQFFPQINRSTMKHYRRLAKNLIFASGLGAFIAAPAFAEMS